MKPKTFGMLAAGVLACVGAVVSGLVMPPRALAGGGATADLQTIQGKHIFWLDGTGSAGGISLVGSIEFDGNGKITAAVAHGEIAFSNNLQDSIDQSVTSTFNGYELVSGPDRVYNFGQGLLFAVPNSTLVLNLQNCRFQLLDSRGTAGRLTASFQVSSSGGGCVGVAMGETKSQ